MNSDPASGAPTRTVLAPGVELGPYRIEGVLGEGGMGQVFRGVDTRLGRSVAIKVSREAFGDRFEREARAIAALNHPHICTLYDVGPNYLVMELVEGETLAARLKRGRLSIGETLKFGAQIASALAAAHARGIVHRDLKPGNIMLTKSGVKVLDFGLAKAESDETLTVVGAVMGTPAYMAPEQRAGGATDARTDIYAQGLILAEMAVGRRISADDGIQLGEWPSAGATAINRCLEPDPADRWQSARDLQIVLQTLLDSGLRVAKPRGTHDWLVGAAGGVALLALAAVAWMSLHQAPAASGSYRLDIPAPSGTTFLHSGGIALSPDGRQVAFVASSQTGSQIWVRPLDASEAKRVPGTEGAASPFWSPDGKSLGFFGGGRLQRVDLSGGAPRPVCEVGTGRGAVWSPQQFILFNSVNDGPLLKVPAEGGTPVPFTKIDTSRGENAHRYPQLLPDGKHFLYFIRGTDYVEGAIGSSGEYVGSLDDPSVKTKILSSRIEAVVAPGAAGGSDSLLYMREDGSLVAQTFDVDKFQLQGEARVLARGLSVRDRGSRLIDAATSAAGNVVYGIDGTNQFQMTWISRDGDRTGMVGEPQRYDSLRISPDGKRVVYALHGAIWQAELARGVATKVADGDFNPVWSPDGQKVAYTFGAPPNLFVRDIQAIAPEQRLTASPDGQTPMDWSPDGNLLLYANTPNNPVSKNRLDLWTLGMKDSNAANAVTSTPFHETNGQFSPDGHWLAYTSDESGHSEILVQSFPGGARKWTVSNKGGNWVRWRRDGKELYYLAPNGNLMSAEVRAAKGELEFSTPVPRFEFPNHSLSAVGPFYPYDVAPDGRFLILTPAGSEISTLTVLTNWRGAQSPDQTH